MAGLVFMLRSEISARIEMAVIVLAFLWLTVLGRPLSNFLVVAMLACFLLAMEAVNTAIEVVVDKISPEQSKFGKSAKDLGSTAVFLTLAAGGVYLAAVTAEAFGLASL